MVFTRGFATFPLIMKLLITPCRPEHFSTISNYFPQEWNFDFRKFISINHNRNYFRGFSLLDGGESIGFGNLMGFGTVCWIGNIVISEKHRKKGYGTQITRSLIQKGRELGANTFNLVATELGESIYRKLGFETECMYEFYKLEDRALKFEISKKIRKANPSDLLKVKLTYGDKKVVVPSMNVKARDFLIQHGFKKSMELPRMTLGEKCNWKPKCIFSRGTGYCG